MVDNYKMRISYHCDSKLYASSKDKTGHYVIDFNATENSVNCILKPTVKMNSIKFTLTFDCEYNPDTVVFPNGYQSWTDSREMRCDDAMPPLTKFATAIDPISHSSAYGDYTFTSYTKEKGVFHGFSYGYIRNDDTYELLGSLKEDNGFTIFYYDTKRNIILAQKELEGLSLEAGSEYDLMDLFYAKGGYDEVFDAYFTALKIEPPKQKTLTGYTSWYNYYSRISEDIIIRDLESISALDNKLDIFQIDDGFQTATGDWLSIDAVKFPNGLKTIVDKIHSKNLKAGLWLAPFNASRTSKLFMEHSTWFVKNAKGHSLPGGANWGGFYTLDIYNEDARQYIKDVFNTVLNDWGFDMVKLDFLYSVCIVPYNGKTRGEIMTDAINLLRECVGDKLILGCGVPLFPTFGKLDFCRIGCDVGLTWKEKNYFAKLHREDVSTENTIVTSIFRRHLDGRAFVNDPDVIILRDGVAMTIENQELLATVNKICGNILFVSDNISEYDERRKNIFEKFVNKNERKVIDAKYVAKNTIYIKYELNGVTNEITFNVKTGNII